MTIHLPPQDAEPWLAKLGQGQAEGLLDYMDANMPELGRLIDREQKRPYETAQLQQRARGIPERHEPPADKRLRR